LKAGAQIRNLKWREYSTGESPGLAARGHSTEPSDADADIQRIAVTVSLTTAATS